MIVTEDFSHISKVSKEQALKGYAELSVHSLVFDRYFTDEQIAENNRQFKALSQEQRNERSKKTSLNAYESLSAIIQRLSEKYRIYQYDENVSYKSDWDLFFYSNRIWNGQKHFDYMTLSFNDERSVKQNLELKDEVTGVLKDMDFDNVYCRVQYSLNWNYEKLRSRAEEIYEANKNKFVKYRDQIGKIKQIDGGAYRYGFFKKGARSRYSALSYVEMIASVEN